MSQQALDLRSSIQAVRRHRNFSGAILVLGLLVGAAYAVLKPPPLSSTALVVLPQPPPRTPTRLHPGVANSEIATQVVVASSDPVLADALPHVSPAMSLQALESKVQVTNVAGSILSITATGATAAEAEATANAVADSYIAYVGSANSPVGVCVGQDPRARLLPRRGTKLPERIAIYALLGLIGGALVGLIVAIAMSRNRPTAQGTRRDRQFHRRARSRRPCPSAVRLTPRRG